MSMPRFATSSQSSLGPVAMVTTGCPTNVSTRVKMAQTSNVFAVAMLGDGRTLFAKKEVKVTLGGCGG